jgi:hypothetical protein
MLHILTFLLQTLFLHFQEFKAFLQMEVLIIYYHQEQNLSFRPIQDQHLRQI